MVTRNATFYLVLLFASALAGLAHNHQHKDDKHRERESDGAFSPRDAGHKPDTDDHDTSFDHEAILGSTKEAQEFDQLPPEEAKKRLRILLEKMDRNEDGLISKEELKQWIVRSFKKLSQEESDERFKESDKNEDGIVTWDEYVAAEFDLEDGETEETIRTDPDRADEYNLVEEDKVLFNAADKNQDGHLDKSEFVSFTHPEDDEAMHESVVSQLLKQKDTNGDGSIDFQEFVGERGKDQNKDWLEEEKDRFDKELDKDGDGLLGKPEILAWMIPSNADMADDEVNHLFAGSDDDNDGTLTFDEAVEHHDLFVGSEATDYGEHLQNLHKFDDEL